MLDDLTTRNSRSLPEMVSFATAKPTRKIGTSYNAPIPGASFSALGEHFSPYYDRKVYVGVKHANLDGLRGSSRYFYDSLANLLVFDHFLPEFRDMMPLFMGGIQRGDATVGIIMEDFSEGGKYHVWESRNSNLTIPKPFWELVEGDGISRHLLESAFFEVNGKLRLGDLDAISWIGNCDDKYWEIRKNLQDPNFKKAHVIHV